MERIEDATGVRPVVNQIELHPRYPQEEALAYHRAHGSSPRRGARSGGPARCSRIRHHDDRRRTRDHAGAGAGLARRARRGRDPEGGLSRASGAEPRRGAGAADGDDVDAITALGESRRLWGADPATHEEF
jgi:hypothetical protein